jgi:hypothetical protein
MHTEIYSEMPIGRDNIGTQGVGERIILKWISNK